MVYLVNSGLFGLVPFVNLPGPAYLSSFFQHTPEPEQRAVGWLAMTLLKRIMLILLSIVLVLAMAMFLFLQRPVFGANPAGARLDRINKSPNYRDGSFQNLLPTEVMKEGVTPLKLLRDFMNKSSTNIPPQPLPSVKTDLATLSDSLPTLVWFGHSSYLIKSKGITILLDPVFSGHASPVSFFGKSFPGTDVYGVADMPPIDLLILSHDHYDHLDYETITQLIPKVKMIYTSLGVGAHLEKWGVPADRIVEFDWWESQHITDGIDLTATPARHFSGRSLTRGKTLWSSFVLKLHGHTLFLGGDSGYGTHFREIGAKFGPFDLAILECGQYNSDWPYIHTLPDQIVTVAQELGAKTVLPVHWGKFALAYHAWNEPIRQLVAHAAEHNLPLATPQIGEPVVVGSVYPQQPWWNF